MGDAGLRGEFLPRRGVISGGLIHVRLPVRILYARGTAYEYQILRRERRRVRALSDHRMDQYRISGHRGHTLARREPTSVQDPENNHAPDDPVLLDCPLQRKSLPT